MDDILNMLQYAKGNETKEIAIAMGLYQKTGYIEDVKRHLLIKKLEG